VRWDDLRQSTNIEDVRGSTGGAAGLRLGVGGTLLVSWFRRGLDGGTIADCDTFSARS
jgi:predicted metalloprotease